MGGIDTVSAEVCRIDQIFLQAGRIDLIYAEVCRIDQVSDAEGGVDQALFNISTENIVLYTTKRP